MREPLRSRASTTTTAEDSPLIRRFRSGKNPGSGWVPGKQLADDGPLALDMSRETAVPRRVDVVGTARQHRHRAPAGFQGTAVRRTVDSQGEPRNHHHAGAREVPGERVGGVQAVGGGGARAHDRHARGGERRDVAAHQQQRRRIGEPRQARRDRPETAAEWPARASAGAAWIAASRSRAGRRRRPIRRQRLARTAGGAQQRGSGDGIERQLPLQGEPVAQRPGHLGTRIGGIENAGCERQRRLPGTGEPPL